VLDRLVEQGFVASLGLPPGADLVACSPGGSRVALLRIHVRDARGRYALSAAAGSRARNRAHVFVDFPADTLEPVCFVVPAVVVAAALGKAPGWPAGLPTAELAIYREAWHLLGLKRPGGVRSAPVSSPSSPVP